MFSVACFSVTLSHSDATRALKTETQLEAKTHLENTCFSVFSVSLLEQDIHEALQLYKGLPCWRQQQQVHSLQTLYAMASGTSVYIITLQSP